ncbi:MAG: DNA-binding protein, partial [Opitutaceae bacterium]|nr:DNA-binding protein [Opitutaceae bacterium]
MSTPAPPSDWSTWTPLAHAPRLSPATLAELVDGGQAFRWQRLVDDTWLGHWADHLVRLRLSPAGTLEWSAPAARAAHTGEALSAYLFGHDTAAAIDALPWRSDPHLARCLTAFPGLTILRQPFGETLLGFLCSATKQIVQIKQMIAHLAERHGSPFPGTVPASTPEKAPATPNPICHLISDKPVLTFDFKVDTFLGNRLPTWSELAKVSESDLRACLLGFRARYIHQ